MPEPCFPFLLNAQKKNDEDVVLAYALDMKFQNLLPDILRF